MGCRELGKAGMLGRLSGIEQVRNGDRPYWYEYLNPDVRAEDLDWKTDHWVNWYRCMRDGKTPNPRSTPGYHHSIASIMATMSYETGRRTKFDPAKRTISLH